MTISSDDHADSPISQDMPCVACGYNLRGLRTEGVCPECATPVSRSELGVLLRYSNPAWLRRLRLGALLMMFNLGFLALGAIVSIAPRFLDAGVDLVGAGVGLCGILLLTSPEPRSSLTDSGGLLLRVVRLCVIFGCLRALLGLIACSTPPNTILSASCRVLWAAWPVAYIGLMIHLRRLAGGIPSVELAHSTTRAMWGLAIASGLALSAGTVGLLLGEFYLATGAAGILVEIPDSNTDVGMFLEFMFALGFLGIHGFGIYYFLLLVQYRKAFSVSARLAGRIDARFKSGDRR